MRPTALPDLSACLMINDLPPGVVFVRNLSNMSKRTKELLYQASVLVLTFLAYTAYHASRKPISIVKNSPEFLDCSREHQNDQGCSSWIKEIRGRPEEEARTMLGFLDTTYLVSYAIMMFISGLVAERVNLRIYLSAGMILSGLFTAMFGLARPLGIHGFWYLVLVQFLAGAVQTTGWPGVVSVMANWFGKGKRGLIMGIWNSHTSIGNILGALIAGAYVNDNWGLSFILPGLFIAAMGGLVFLFLVPDPSMVGLAMPNTTNRCRSPSNVNIVSVGDSQSSLPKSVSLTKTIDSAYESDSELLIVPKEGQAIGFLEALRIPGVIEFSLCLFFAKLVSYTFLFWLPHYIGSTSGLDARSAAHLSIFFDVGGIVGGILAGLISDKSGMSATTCGVMLVLAIPTMFLYQVMEGFWCPMSQVNGLPIMDNCYLLNIAMLMITGLLVNGPYALITTAVSAELGTHRSLANSGKALATVTAIIDGTGSVGAAVGPFLAGWLAGDGNWDRVFSMLMMADVFALILLIRLMKQEVRKWHRRRLSY